MEENLIPLRWEDVKDGMPVIVIDATGKRFDAAVLDKNEYRFVVLLPAGHTTSNDDGSEPEAEDAPFTWVFLISDFDDGHHGDYGLKLYRAADPDEAVAAPVVGEIAKIIDFAGTPTEVVWTDKMPPAGTKLYTHPDPKLDAAVKAAVALQAARKAHHDDPTWSKADKVKDASAALDEALAQIKGETK